MRPLAVGDIISCERTFSVEDVQSFTRVSGDEGAQHVRPDAEGRLRVQSLLLSTLPTQIGGRYDLVASDMSFTFLGPVHTGDRVHCDVEVAETEPLADGIRVALAITCRNQHGKEVMIGTCRGVVRAA